MKKLISGLATGALIFLSAMPAMAAKPAGNLASAQKVDWNLSADVMPVPPYGSVDIAGSDIASKLIVNQPNGATEVTLTGVMNGLNPSTEYTVYLSNGYTPYLFTGWNAAGTYVINVNYNSVDYPETLILTQNGTAITGTSLDTIPAGSFFIVYDGSVIGNVVNIIANRGSLVVHMEGTIAPDGSMSGTWHDELPGTRTGTWSTTSGAAVKTHTGDLGWSGLFTSTVQPFTFTTDEFGTGSWHLNLRDTNFSNTGDHAMSVWINAGGTLLVSDTFHVISN